MILDTNLSFAELFWSAFSRIPAGYGVSLRIQSECGKMPTRIALNMDTFYTVTIPDKSKGIK